MVNSFTHQTGTAFSFAQDDWEIQSRINRRVKSYLQEKGYRHGNHKKVWLKTGLLGLGIMGSYWAVLYAPHVTGLALAYLALLSMSLILAMTIGHDAAHGAFTGKRNRDSFIYQLIFMINGINPGPWKARHNKSHHHFPNVHGLDSDLVITRLIYLSHDQRKYKLHAYQHVYAPFLYLFFSLSWILVIDFNQHVEHMKSLRPGKQKLAGWIRIVLVKIFYVLAMIAVPVWLSGFTGLEIMITWLVCQMILSVLLSFTFFMSHHVQEAAYFTNNGSVLDTSWLQNQVSSTVDFHGQSPVANLIFGGFHAHVAHHLFPNVSHIHYPVVTRIIKEELEGTHVRYQSISFLRGMASHLRLLKEKGANQKQHSEHLSIA